MNVTSVRVRPVRSNSLYAVASVTMDDELIINDIRIYNNGGQFDIRLPNSHYAEENGQQSIVPFFTLRSDIKQAILCKLAEQENKIII